MNDVTVNPAPTATYAWEGTLRNGRKVSGETRGHSPAVIKAQLRRQGINLVRVQMRSSLLSGLRNPITPADVALFTRQLATLLKAGIPLLQAFDMIGEGFENRAMRTMVQGLKQEIAAGNSLTGALLKQPQCFNALYCSLIAAGEQAGTLETLLERVATHLEKSQRLKARIKKAMTYPLVVLLVATLVSSILLIHVVPQFESLFTGIDTPLPRFTLLVIVLSEFMQSAWWMLLLAVAATTWGIRRSYRRHSGFRLWLDAGLLKVPLAGTLLKKNRCRPLRSHPRHHLCRRRTAGTGVGFSGGSRRQRTLQTSSHAYAPGRSNRNAIESNYDRQRPVPWHGDPDDSHRRRIGRTGQHAGEGRRPL